MWILGLSKDEKQLIEDLRENVKTLKLATRVVSLQQQVEAKEKEERELRHMIGLEKKRQEFEIEQAKKETSLKVREENLSADKKRFEEQMKFHETRFTEEVGYLKDMVKNVLDRLPNVSASFERKGK